MIKARSAILCIDDDMVVRTRLGEVLAYNEFKPVHAANAEDALRLASREDICLIVLDIDISGENGSALLPYLKLNHPDIPIVVYTVLQHDEQQVASFFEQGASGYVRKSEPMKELVEVIQMALASRPREPQQQPAIGIGRRVQQRLQRKLQSRAL